MEPEVVRDPKTGRKRRPGCCALSCGGCLVVLLLGAVAAGWLWTRTGSPWLTEQRARLTERYPWAARLWQTGTALEGFDLGAVSPGDLGSTDPGDFPEDVWLPESPETTYNTREDYALAAVTLLDGDPASIAGRCRREMTARGWHAGDATPLHGGRLLVFDKSGRRASVRLFDGARGLEVWVEVPRGP